jgi:hypothetical protein
MPLGSFLLWQFRHLNFVAKITENSKVCNPSDRHDIEYLSNNR